MPKTPTPGAKNNTSVLVTHGEGSYGVSIAEEVQNSWWGTNAVLTELSHYLCINTSKIRWGCAPGACPRSLPPQFRCLWYIRVSRG